MRVEAESHAEEDRRRMEEVEARNRLDGLVYQAEKTIRENREKLPEADVKSAEEALEGAKKAISDGGGTAALRGATENVERALHKLAETLYKSSQAQQAEAASAGPGQAGPSGSQGGAQGGGNKPGDVIDAEYVDVDDKKAPN
jgi:molecular chaperone DnaK